MILAPPSLYREADLRERAAIVERHLSRWYISQACFGLGMLVVGIGFLVLTRSRIASAGQWMAYAGAAALLIAGVIGSLAVYGQTLDPVGFWSGPNSPVEVAAGIALLAMTMLGLGLWGVLFVQGFQPTWIGYLMAASAGLFTLVYIITRGGGAFFLISLAYLVTFVGGIALVRSGG